MPLTMRVHTKGGLRCLQKLMGDLFGQRRSEKKLLRHSFRSITFVHAKPATLKIGISMTARLGLFSVLFDQVESIERMHTRI